MARTEKVTFTNMCMISDGRGNVLVQDRLDPDWPGIAFPGGHVEKGESFVDAMVREVYEETGLTVSNLTLCGIKIGQTQTDPDIL
jgi:8-oxo-dGTP diphosphatase